MRGERRGANRLRRVRRCRERVRLAGIENAGLLLWSGLAEIDDHSRLGSSRRVGLVGESETGLNRYHHVGLARIEESCRRLNGGRIDDSRLQGHAGWHRGRNGRAAEATATSVEDEEGGGGGGSRIVS